MKGFRILSLLLLVPVSALVLSAAQTAGWESYRNSDFGYEIEYPAGWEVIEAQPRADDAVLWEGEVLFPGVHQKVTFKEPEGSFWPGEFRVLVHELVEGRTLDEWADSTNADVYDDSLVTGAEDVKLAGRDARRFTIFAFDHTGIIVALVHDGKIYQVGYAGSNPNDPDIEEHAAIYQRMQESFELWPSIGAQADTFDLGGPCDESLSSGLSDFYQRFAEASEQGDQQQLIDLQRLYVRAMCSNLNRWYGLAEVYLGAGQPEMATQVLEELFRRGAELKPSTFEFRETLAAFIATTEFQETELGQRLEALKSASAQRRAAYREELKALDPSLRPPERYVAEGACPFECCTYREWEVLETTSLTDEPFGTIEVGTVLAGQRVLGVTGEVHLRPEPIAVVHEHPPFAMGEVLFLLDYIGEGFYRYWRNGEIGEEELWMDDFCLRPGRGCWAEYLRPPAEREEAEWWVLIETEDGVRGWTNQPQHFGNKDACG